MFSQEGNGTFYKIYEDSVNKKGCDLYIVSGKTKGHLEKCLMDGQR